MEPRLWCHRPGSHLRLCNPLHLCQRRQLQDYGDVILPRTVSQLYISLAYTSFNRIFGSLISISILELSCAPITLATWTTPWSKHYVCIRIWSHLYIFMFTTAETENPWNVSGLEMSLYWEFPWVPWESHGNGNSYSSFTGMGMGMWWWEWEGMKIPRFPFRMI